MRRALLVGGYGVVLGVALVVLLSLGLGGGSSANVAFLAVPLGAAAFWFPLRVVRAHVRFDFDGSYLRIHDGIRSRVIASTEVVGFELAPSPGPFDTPVVTTVHGSLRLDALRCFSLGPLANHAEVRARLRDLNVELAEVVRRREVRPT